MTARLMAVWLRIEISRRWRPLLILIVLVSLSAGAVLTAVAGARRGSTAADRLQAGTLPATALVRANYTGRKGQPGFGWDRVRQFPDVAAVSLYAGYSGFAIDEAPADTVGLYVPLDALAMHTIERPVVLAGRLADPARADESVITEGFRSSYGPGLGDTVTLRLFAPEQVDTGVSAVRTIEIPRPAGHVVRSRIVGVVRSPWFTDDVGRPGWLIPSPGLAAAYPQDVLGQNVDGESWAMVRLRTGDTGLAAFRAELLRLPNAGGSDVIPRSQITGHLRDVSRFEAGCLLALAGAVLLVAAFLVGQAIVRHVASSAGDLIVLIALGLSRPQAVAVAATAPALAGLIGSVLGAGLAVLASGWLPFGVAATLEPAPGLDADVLVLGLGVALAALAAAAWAAAATWLELLLRRRPVVPGTAIGSTVTTRLPIPIAIGARYALESGRGVRAIPVRSALAGSVIGVLGVVSAATFAVAVDDAGRSMQRFGQVHQLVLALGQLNSEMGSPTGQELTTMAGDPDVVSVFDTRFQTAQLPGELTAGGDRSVTVFRYTPAQDAGATGVPDPIVLTKGNVPSAADEVVLAPGTAHQLGATTGSVVTLQGRIGTPGPDGVQVAPETRPVIRAVVSGVGFVPQTGYNEYDSGAWVSAAGYQRMFAREYLNREALVTLRQGADPEVVAGRYLRSMATTQSPFPEFIDRPMVPRRSIEIRDLRVLPLLLAGFLAVLALAATAHVLTVSVSRRRGELAVLRAVGMTRRQTRLVPITQAAVYGLAGLVFGIPLGVALGRTLWRVVAGSTPLAYVPPSPVAVLVLAVPVTLVAVQLLAVPAGRRMVRMRVADALRAE